MVSWRWRRIPIDLKSIPPAKDVAVEVARWDARVDKVVNVPIGEARSEYPQPRLKSLIEAAMKEATGAELAFMNPGGIRDRLRRGPLVARDVWNVMPFDNTVVVGKVKGKQLPASVTAGQTVDPEREYSLAINDFTAANQPTQLGATGLVFKDTGKLLRDVIIAYIQKRQVLD